MEQNRKREHIQYSLEMEEELLFNHTYKQEQRLLEYVKSGEVEEVKENLSTIFPQYPQLLGYAEQRNEEYMAVITVALVARAVISAGISTSESFQLSDFYLKKFAAAHDIGMIRSLRDEAVINYTKMVCESKKRTKASFYVEECKKYILANPFKKISTEEIACALHLNAVYLERIFKAEERMTITQYIQNEKIIRAKNLLIYSDRTIQEISMYLGFSSQSYFGKVFQKIVGMTPKQFRIQNRLSEF